MEEENEGEEKESLANRFTGFLYKIVEALTNLPRALVAVGMILSLCGVSYVSFFGAEEDAVQVFVASSSADVEKLEIRVKELEIWNKVLRDNLRAILIAIGGGNTNKTEFEGFLLDLQTGEVIPLEPKKE